ncbi:HprK-related kinase A [Ectothiorhodospira marina]|uniref:HprK-related kinase A n=1 Tax=Ectothiorhodospira marina TaxID=1396821 RepID=A0A1H7IBD1_9GAMM|nr:HprK-related kinase A [Ectothiorhodospira marina]SEK58830.1 hypothetical protein SAMN05444515_10366 [Ectothiorhodospira marina]
MTLDDIPAEQLEVHLHRGDLVIQTGPFRARIRCRIPRVKADLKLMYGHFPCDISPSFADFDISLSKAPYLRRWYKPQVLFFADRQCIFKPLPLSQAFPMLEWGLNWCIANQTTHHLILHAASLERHGRSLIMPAPPGSGKSTLCAALSCRGWRLLSDETTLLELDAAKISGPARPISLKNESVQVIQEFSKDAVLTPPVHDTIKGSVAHMRPSRDSAQSAGVTASPGLVIFPRFQKGAPLQITPTPRSAVFAGLVRNAFNFTALGRTAFHRIADVVSQSEGYDIIYSDLDEVIAQIEELAHGW